MEIQLNSRKAGPKPSNWHGLETDEDIKLLVRAPSSVIWGNLYGQS